MTTHNPYWNNHCVGGRRWTDDEKEKLVAMRAAGKTQKDIADALDRSEEAVKNKINMMKLGAAPYKKARQPRTYSRRKDYTGELIEPIVVPDEVWADRNRRLSAGYESLTAAICGDPVKGSSALDRKRAMAPA